jgi:hypothetical protein
MLHVLLGQSGVEAGSSPQSPSWPPQGTSSAGALEPPLPPSCRRKPGGLWDPMTPGRKFLGDTWAERGKLSTRTNPGLLAGKCWGLEPSALQEIPGACSRPQAVSWLASRIWPRIWAVAPSLSRGFHTRKMEAFCPLDNLCWVSG